MVIAVQFVIDGAGAMIEGELTPKEQLDYR